VDEVVLILSALGLISVVRMCLWSCAECSLLPALMVFDRNWSLEGRLSFTRHPDMVI
jgi:hypothetical protein